MEEHTIPRMRTAKQAAAAIKQLDPETRVREHHIRNLMHSGVLPVISAGRSLFVNLDMLIDYLSTPGNIDLQKPEAGKIRPVPERGR